MKIIVDDQTSWEEIPKGLRGVELDHYVTEVLRREAGKNPNRNYMKVEYGFMKSVEVKGR